MRRFTKSLSELRSTAERILRTPSRRALAVLGLLVFGWALLTASELGAQDPQGAGSAARTETEAEAYRLYTEEQMLSARTKAEEALRANPNSMVGHFVMGAVLHEAEGSLARAMYHLGKSREIYETTWAASTRPAGAPFELHRETLFKIQGLASEMELYEYQLQVLGFHDYIYDPDLIAEHAWPLMQLGRYEEAREFANRAASARSDEYQRSSGLNALCAIEGEAGTRQPYFEACLAALENARRRSAGEEEVGIAVHAYNAAMAAQATMQFDQAETLALEGARRLEFTPANPWRMLARQYVDQGRMTDAVEALREMQRWRRRQPARLRDQARAETDVAFATLLLAAGETELGLRAVDRAIDQPDRRGLTSSTSEQAVGAHALLRRSLRTVELEKQREEASWSGFFPNLTSAVSLGTEYRVATFTDSERVTGAAADDERLVRTLRFYVKGGLEPLPSWLLGDLVEVLGPGVTLAGLRRARSFEPADSPALAYYDGLEAEVALVQGDEDRAFNLALGALERLPSTEAILRARVSLIAGQAAHERGQERKSLELYEQAIQLDGGVFRRHRVSIPARITGSGTHGEEVASHLSRSPRFHDDPGFQVRVSDTGERVEACLLNPDGARLRCAAVAPQQLANEHQALMEAFQEAVDAQAAAPPPEDGQDPPELVAPEMPVVSEVLAEEFHRVLFTASVALSSADLTSLDGRTTTGAEAASEEMRGMLQDLIDRQ